jgi:hypothetical protein
LENFYFWPMGVVPKIIPLLRRFFLVLVYYIVSGFFEIEFPTVFLSPSQLVISFRDCNFSSPQFLLHHFYCCCGLRYILWGESVLDSPFVVIYFLFLVMVDSSFTLGNHLLLECLLVWFLHFGFLLPCVLP